MSHPLNSIATAGLQAVQQRTENATLAAPGAEAQGYALAQTVIAEVVQQHGAFNRYVGRLIELSTEARAAFMKEINRHTKEITQHAEAKKGTDEEARYKKIAATAKTKFAMMVAVVKALNAGFTIECRTNPDNGVHLRDARGILQPVNPYTTIVADARMYLEAAGQKGKGRPVKPWLDKLKDFILNNQPEFAKAPDDAVELVKTLADLTKKAAQQPAALM